MNDQDRSRFCQHCGIVIPNAVHIHHVGFFGFQCERNLCRECEFKEAFRRHNLVGKPFKDPCPRPTPAGDMPAALKEEIAKRYAKEQGGKVEYD